MLLVAPGCLYIFCGEKVNRNSPLRSQLLSNCFRQFCNTDQAYYVPLPDFRINPVASYLAFEVPRAPQAFPMSAGAHHRDAARKDTAWDHRLAVHEGEGELRLQEDHGRLDEVLPESQHDKRQSSGSENDNS